MFTVSPPPPLGPEGFVPGVWQPASAATTTTVMRGHARREATGGTMRPPCAMSVRRLSRKREALSSAPPRGPGPGPRRPGAIIRPHPEAFAVTEYPTRQQLTDIVARAEDDMDLARASLLIACEEYPDLDV